MSNSTVEIPLTQGKVALVDAADVSLVAGFKWQAALDGRSGTWYAQRSVTIAPGKQATVLLHRVILNAPNGVRVDHKNRDGLDCRRINLRLASASQNCQNRRAVNKHGFKGVTRDARQNQRQWRASLGGQKRRVLLGSFNTAEQAARAYDAKAREMYGEFACLNFPEDQPIPELPEVIDVGEDG